MAFRCASRNLLESLETFTSCIYGNLHNASPSCGERMRMMVLDRIVANGVMLYELNRPSG